MQKRHTVNGKNTRTKECTKKKYRAKKSSKQRINLGIFFTLQKITSNQVLIWICGRELLFFEGSNKKNGGSGVFFSTFLPSIPSPLSDYIGQSKYTDVESLAENKTTLTKFAFFPTNLNETKRTSTKKSREQ